VESHWQLGAAKYLFRNTSCSHITISIYFFYANSSLTYQINNILSNLDDLLRIALYINSFLDGLAA